MLLAPVFNFKFKYMLEEENLEYDYEDDEGIEPIISLCRYCNSYHDIHDDCDIDDYEEAYT